MTLTLTFYCPVLVFPALTCITIFVRSSAPVHATGLCSNIMNIRRWYYHILNYGGIGDDLSYFDLSRNLFETQCNGPTIQSTVTRNWKEVDHISHARTDQIICELWSTCLPISRYCRLDIRCLLVSLRGKGYYFSRLSRDWLYPKRFMYLALWIINPNGLHSTTIRWQFWRLAILHFRSFPLSFFRWWYLFCIKNFE